MSEPQINPRVLELLVSHICHDLVSPVGAISNGIEFIEEMGPSVTQDAIGLIGSSVKQASVALQCFRLAYGAAGSGSNVTATDVKTAFTAYIEGGRTTLHWNLNPRSGETPVGFMKVVLNALMMVEECIPSNGDLTIEDIDGGTGMKIIAKAPKIEFKEGVEAAYNHSASIDDLNPRTVHAYITRIYAKYFNVEISHENVSEGEMVFMVSYS